MACFLVGIVLYREKIRYTPLRLLAALIDLCLGAVYSRGWDFAVATCGAYLLLRRASRPIPKLAHWAKYGDFSYGIYLFAYPVQQLLICYFQPSLTPLRLFCLAFPVTLLLAAASWHCVEKPALRLKKGAAQVVRSYAKRQITCSGRRRDAD